MTRAESEWHRTNTTIRKAESRGGLGRNPLKGKTIKELPEAVFCGECEHYRCGYSDRAYEICLAESHKAPKTTATYYAPGVKLPAIEPCEKNAHNNCRDWKRDASRG